MKFIYFIVVIIIVSVSVVNGARILAIFPTPSLSHHIVYRTYTEELARRGHVLTIVTPNPANYTDAVFSNITQLDMHNITYEVYKNSFDFVDTRSVDPSPKAIIIKYYEMLLKVCDAQFSTPEMQKLIHDKNEHFDLVIAEGILPVASAFKDRFNTPLILITSMGLAPHHFDMTGNPDHPIFYPDTFASFDPLKTRIWEKAYLLYRQIMYKIYYNVIYLPIFNAKARKFFGPNTRSVYDIENEVDLILVNYSPIWHGVRPLVPAIVGIANIHLKPEKPLPDNLQILLDNSPQGAIYFSFGTNVNLTRLPSNRIQVFIEAFRKLPYTVIWKWDKDDLKNKPENVYISKWLPQTSILAHPNVKVFITQCGQQSVEEAVAYGVPMVGIPFLFDQMSNAFRAEKHGVGKSVVLEDINENSLADVLTEVITNPKYRQNAERLRILMKDQQVNPLENAVWWTEYVIRHKGAKHLRSPTADASTIQYYALDVHFFVLCCVAIVLYPLIKLRQLLSKYTITVKGGIAKLKIN